MSLYWMRCSTASEEILVLCYVLKTRAGSDATSQGVLDRLESLELCLWKVVVERVAIKLQVQIMFAPTPQARDLPLR